MLGFFLHRVYFSHPSEQEVGAPAVIPLVHRSQQHTRVYYCWMLRSGATSSMYCFLLRWMTQIINQHTTTSLRDDTTAKVQGGTCYISTSVVCKLIKKDVWLVHMESQNPGTATINWIARKLTWCRFSDCVYENFSELQCPIVLAKYLPRVFNKEYLINSSEYKEKQNCCASVWLRIFQNHFSDQTTVYFKLS